MVTILEIICQQLLTLVGPAEHKWQSHTQIQVCACSKEVEKGNLIPSIDFVWLQITDIDAYVQE